MPQPVSGVSGVSGVRETGIQNPEGTPEETFGGPAQPHADITQTIFPYQTVMGQPVHGPYGTAQPVIEDEPTVLNAGISGDLLDNTPRNHAAPWPKGITSGSTRDAQEAAWEAQASLGRHSADFGAKNARLYGDISPSAGNHLVIDYVDAGDSMLDGAIPGQLRGQRGRDRVQGYQKQNQYGFDSAHVHGTYSMPGVPGNHFMLKPGGRPLLIDPPGGNVAAGTGQDSVFAGQQPQSTFSPQGAVLTQPPAAYVQPPQGYVGPPMSPTSQAWGWPEW